MRNKTPYRVIQRLAQGKFLLILVITLLIAASSIIRSTPVSEKKYELCESNAEQEERNDFNLDDNQEFYAMYSNSSSFNLKYTIGMHFIQKEFKEFNPKIVIPPPK